MAIVVFDYQTFWKDWKTTIGKKHVKKYVMVDKLSMA